MLGARLALLKLANVNNKQPSTQKELHYGNKSDDKVTEKLIRAGCWIKYASPDKSLGSIYLFSRHVYTNV